MLGNCSALGLPCVPARAGQTEAKDFRDNAAAFRAMGAIKVCASWHFPCNSQSEGCWCKLCAQNAKACCIA
jgi:hypothetical protein